MGYNKFGKSRKRRNRLEDIHYKIRQPWSYDLWMARHMVFPCGWTPEGYRKASQCLTWLCTSIICNWWKCLQCSTVATCCWALEIWIKYGGEFWVFVLFICKIWIYICLVATHIVSTVKLQLLKGWGCDCTHLLCPTLPINIMYVFLPILTSSLPVLFTYPPPFT